jgi:alkylation response protein AidB-like acyl-CoA dehydrogenase
VGTARGDVGATSVIDVAKDAQRLDDPCVRDLVGEARMLDVVRHELQHRVTEGIASGRLSDQASAIVRLFTGVVSTRMTTIAFEIAGSAGAAWTDDEDGAAADWGTVYLMRQASCIGGGTTEMARNVISERVLGMPRERTVDRDVAFRDVPRGRPGTSRWAADTDDRLEHSEEPK